MDSISDNTLFFTLAVALVILFGMNQNNNKSQSMEDLILYPSQHSKSTKHQLQDLELPDLGEQELQLPSQKTQATFTKKQSGSKAIESIASTLTNTGCNLPLGTPTWNLYNTANVSMNYCNNLQGKEYQELVTRCIPYVGSLNECMQSGCQR